MANDHLQLGCVVNYTALIRTKEGIPIGELPVSGVHWERKLDDISEAVIEVPLSGENCAPCDLIKLIAPGVWHYELVLLRDSVFVWSGPFVVTTVGRFQATFRARDLFGLLDQRLLHETHCFAVACGTEATDLADIARILIDDAFAVDGHGYEIFEFNKTAPALDGGLGERLYLPGEHAFEALQEELKLGLDATVIGTRIVLGAAPFGRTSVLTSDDFLVDLEVETNGLELATRVVTLGDGAVGVATYNGADDIGLDPYYGLLEFEGNNRQELDTVALADQGASAIVKSRYPAPVTISTPAGAALSPTAPVAINDLIPGVLMPIIVTNLCIAASGEYILLQLDVDWSVDTGAETVSVTFGNITSTNSGEGTS